MRRLTLGLLALALLAFTSAAAAAATHLDLSATLTAGSGYPGAHGTADYSGDRGSREADITLTGIRRLAGQRVVVYLAGKKLATLTVSRQGGVHRDWSTIHHQTVPLAGVGSTIRVRDAHGALIASGHYHTHVSSHHQDHDGGHDD